MPVLLLSYVDATLVVCRCIQRNFYEQMFFEISVAEAETNQFFWELIAWTVKFSLENLHVSWRLWFLYFNHNYKYYYIHKYFSEEWEKIYQFSLKSKTAEGNSTAKSFP